MDYDKTRKAIGCAAFAAFPLLFILLVCMKLFHIATAWLLLLPAVLCVVCYALFGFVGLAFIFSASAKKKIALSNFFLRISFFPTLLSLRKAYYLWTKSVNTALKNSTEIQKADFEKAFALAKKVKPENLRTLNDKAMFLCWLAVLYADSGDEEKAYSCIQQAQEVPYKKAAVEEHINQVIDLMKIHTEEISCQDTTPSSSPQPPTSAGSSPM